MKQTLKFLVLHGPNLNLLGEREPEVYGKMTLPELNTELKKFAKTRSIQIKSAQSNHEGELIDLLHEARKWADAVVINPGAYTHYSYAIRDAIASIQIPTAEVHLSDIKKREKFRRISVVEPVCEFQVCGLGWKSYTRAMELLVKHLRKDAKNGR
jgi:3-dehydroquinate dehydratase-2